MVRHWFQNLKRADRSKRLFRFRGSVNYGKRLENGVMRDVGRRGGSSSERGIDRDSVYQFIGPRPIANGVAETST